MAEFLLSTVMDAIANKLMTDNIVKTAYAYPAPQIVVPCAVVGWPEKIDFDLTFKRGADRLEFPVWMVVGGAYDKGARDALSATISGVAGIKDSLDGNLSGAIQTGRVVDCVVEILEMPSGIQYLTAKFLYEVIA